jgi:hypothetical protein
MDNLSIKESYSTEREDGQNCPVVIEEDNKTGERKARQKSSPFYAYNKQNYKAKILLAREKPVANSILEFFVSEMDNTNAICISMNTLEKLFKMKRNAISKHIKILVKRKFVEIFKIGNMNVYAINAYVVFTQGDANLHKAKFTSTMILDFDEQSDMVKREYSKQIIIKKGRK